MHTKTTPGLAFDSLCPVEGSFRLDPFDGSIMEFAITMIYANRSTKETFGKAIWPAEVLSDKTMTAFKDFMKSAEEDVAKILYVERADGDKTQRAAHSWEKAEGPGPLKRPKGLGGT
jgi:hypothetical protein